MKKNKELTHKETKTKLNKKNYIIIIIPIILAIILIITIAIFTYNYNKPSNKLKRTLLNNDYTCTKTICTKEDKNYLYKINYIKGEFYAENDSYKIYLNNNNPTIEEKKTDRVCTYTKDNSQKLDIVDSTYTYDSTCQKYIENVNNVINSFQALLNEAKVDVNNF